MKFHSVQNYYSHRISFFKSDDRRHIIIDIIEFEKIIYALNKGVKLQTFDQWLEISNKRNNTDIEVLSIQHSIPEDDFIIRENDCVFVHYRLACLYIAEVADKELHNLYYQKWKELLN